MKTLRLASFNEILYSYISILFSENKFQEADDILKMVGIHVNSFKKTDSFKLFQIQFSYSSTDRLTPLITLLKSIIDFTQWKVIVTRDDFDKDYVEQLAERCVFQLRESINHFDIADIQIIKVSEVIIYLRLLLGSFEINIIFIIDSYLL